MNKTKLANKTIPHRINLTMEATQAKISYRVFIILSITQLYPLLNTSLPPYRYMSVIKELYEKST